MDVVAVEGEDNKYNVPMKNKYVAVIPLCEEQECGSGTFM